MGGEQISDVRAILADLRRAGFVLETSSKVYCAQKVTAELVRRLPWKTPPSSGDVMRLMKTYCR